MCGHNHVFINFDVGVTLLQGQKLLLENPSKGCLMDLCPGGSKPPPYRVYYNI